MGKRMQNNNQRAGRIGGQGHLVPGAAWASGTRRLALTGALVLAVLLGGTLAIGSQTALAASKFRLESSFGGQGSGAGQFEEPGAVAVEASTGDVFVLDTKNERIEKFQPAHGAGTYEAVGEIAEAAKEDFEFKDDPGIAVDNSTDMYAGDLYVVAGKPKKEIVYQLRPVSGKPNEYEATGTRLEGLAKEKVHGLAVGGNGYVYVSSGTSVSVFSPTGELVRSLSGASSEIRGVAVADSDVYVATLTGLERWKLNSAYEIEASTLVSAAPAGSAYEAVAIDRQGRVYVDAVYAKEEGRSSVTVFAASAVSPSLPVEEFGGEGVVQISAGLAYDAVEGVPTVLTSDTTDDEIHVFQYTAPEVTSCGVAPGKFGASVTCTVAPDASQATWELAYHAPLEGFVEALHGITAGEAEVGGELTGLEPEEAYTYKLEATNASGMADAEGEFETLPIAPLAFTSAAAGVSARAVTLEGTVDPEHDLAFYRFQYGACTSETSCATSPFPEESPEETAGSGRGDVAVGDALTELQPDTSYHYRVVAINAGGETVSGEESFTTVAPSQAEAQTGPVSGVTQTGATISGTVDPNGEATTFIWEVGASTSYGFAFYRSMDAEAVPESVSLVLTELLPDMTYHYRLVATNASGTVYGADQTFTTLAYGGAPFTTPTSLGLLPVYQQGSPAPTGEVLPSREVKPTKAQLLAKALKACKRDKPKSKRAACERQARKKYGTQTPKKK
jgi:hypothetical protein